MGIATLNDPAAVVNAKARAEGWKFRCDTDLVFDKAELNTLRDVWRAQAFKAGVADYRAPGVKGLDGALRRLTVLERVIDDQGQQRYRVEHQGTYMAAVMGSNAGRFIDQGIPPMLLPRWTTVFDAVLDSGVPMRVNVAFELDRLSYATGEAFIAPLANEAGATTMLLVGAYIKPREEQDA